MNPSPIKLAVSTYCLCPCRLEDALRNLASVGYRSVEIPTFCHGPEDAALCADPRRLRDALNRHGLALAALYPPPINVHQPDSLRATVDGVKKAIDVALELGCERIVFSPLVPTQNYPYNLLIESTLECADHAKGTALLICLENHAHWPLSTAADFRKCAPLWAHPNCRITLDTGHFTAVGQDILAFYQEFRPYIAHIHLKDHRGPLCVPLGTGETNNPALFEQLHRDNFHGVATVEIEVEDKLNSLRYLRDAIDYAKRELHVSA